MQRDMHFYATYVLARASGMGVEIARRVAEASQYVDEAVEARGFMHPRGVRVVPEVSAHHLHSIENLNADDQRRVWVPFHFFPGGVGRTTLEKLVCRPMGRPLQALVRHYIQVVSGEEFFPELLGISAHVVMDSFSHAGFSGVASPLNRVVQSSVEFRAVCAEPVRRAAAERGLAGKVREFFRRFKQEAEEVMEELKEEIAAIVGEGLSSALGHAGAATLPDRGYVRWSCEYEVGGRRISRDNPRVFWRASREVYRLFSQALEAAPALGRQASPTPLEELATQIKRLIRTCGEWPDRCRAWREAIAYGRLYPLAPGEAPPIHSPARLERPLRNLPEAAHPWQIRKKFIYRFYQAASYHRHYSLRRLLPAWGIIVA